MMFYKCIAQETDLRAKDNFNITGYMQYLYDVISTQRGGAHITIAIRVKSDMKAERVHLQTAVYPLTLKQK